MVNNSSLTGGLSSFLTEGLLSLGPYHHHPLSLQIESVCMCVCSVSIDLRPFKAPNIQLSLNGAIRGLCPRNTGN